jgi:O-antigen/teichoic acid export membrane protein
MMGVGRASLLVLVGRTGGNLGYFGAAIVLARGLGPAARGEFAFFTTVALAAAVLSAGGLREATSVFLVKEPQHRPQLAVNTVVFGLALALVAAGIVSGVLLALPGAWPGHFDTTLVVLLTVGILAAASVYLGFSTLIGLSGFRQQAILQPLYVWSYAVALAVALWGWGLAVTSAAEIWIGGQLLGGVLLITASLRRSGAAKPSVTLFRRTWVFGLRAWLGSLSTLLNFRLDQVIMGALSTPAALGVYAVAVNASEVELYVPQSVSNGLVPIIAGTALEERSERTLRVFRLVTLVTVTGAAVAFALGPYLLPRVFGGAFRPSVGPFLWLVVGGVGFVASSIFSAALVASDAPGRSSYGPFASLVVGAVLDFALIPPHGAIGAAIAAAAAFFAGGLVAAGTFRRVNGISWRRLLPGRSTVEDVVALLKRSRA